MLAKYAAKVVVAFDMDKAGIKATDKAIDYLEELGVSVRILQMQGAKDPDEFIKQYGKERFAMLISGSKNPTQYALEKLSKEHDLGEVAGRTEYVRQAVRLLAQISSDIERELFCGTLAKQTDISKETIRMEVERARKRYVRQTKEQIFQKEASGFKTQDRVNPERAQNLRAAKAEEGLIALLAHSPDKVAWLTEQLPPQEFVTKFNRRVYEFFIQKIGEGVSPENVLSVHFEGAEVAKIMQILNTVTVGEDVIKQMGDYIRTLKEEQEKKIGGQSPEQIKNMLKSKRS